MRKNNFRLFAILTLICLAALAISGCVFIIGGAVGAAAGYSIISPDTIEGMVDKNYEDIWESAVKVANIMGNLKFKDRNKGYLESEVGNSKVNINIERLTDETTKIRIKARKFHKLMPDMSLAQKIYTKIMQEIE